MCKNSGVENKYTKILESKINVQKFWRGIFILYKK